MPTPDELNWDFSGRPLQYRANQVGIFEHPLNLEEIARAAYRIQQEREAHQYPDEIDFMVPSQADAYRMHTALQRYYMNPATHTPVEPPKPVEDPFLNHYL